MAYRKTCNSVANTIEINLHENYLCDKRKRTKKLFINHNVLSKAAYDPSSAKW